MNRKSILPLVVLIFAIVGLLVVGGLLLIWYGTQQIKNEPIVAATNDLVAADPTTIATPIPTSVGVNLLPPAITVFPTNTPAPTDTPTSTPLPTDTPLPTVTPIPTATNTPVPVVLFSTNTPVPASTNTPGPTNTAAPPQGTNGLTATHFALQARSDFRVGQPVWFEFTIVNSTGSPVPFGALGVMPKKDGTDRLSWYQHSWGGNDDAIQPSGLSWEDNIRLPETGNYTLRLVICFDDTDACKSGGGTWITMSQEIAVTISN